MSEKLNRDGLVPGQAVDFSTMQRIELERSRKAKGKAAPKPKEPEAAKSASQSGFKAEHTGGGWYIVKKTDGTEVSGKLRQQEAMALIEKMQADEPDEQGE